MLSIVGTGNVAWSLAKAFHSKGVEIDYILARDESAGKVLADYISTRFLPLDQADKVTSKVVLLCISDDALSNVSGEYEWSDDTCIAHTSGPTSMKALSIHDKRGVFYPLQSMNKNENPDFKEVPILLEASSPACLILLSDLAKIISDDVRTMESEARLALHVAAVWANNFVNHLNAEAIGLAEKHKVPFDLLKPLIQKTAEIALHGNSAKSQTGPAIRGDESTMNKHLDFLDSRQSEIYRLLSSSIQKNNETEL